MQIILIASTGTQDDPFYFPELYAGFRQGVMDFAGVEFPLGESTGAHEVVTPEILAGRPLDSRTGIVYVMTRDDDHAFLEALHDAGHAVVAVNSYNGTRPIPCVRMDDARGIHLAVEHLVSLGHKKIGYIGGDPGNPDAADRLRGFQASSADRGVSSDYVAGSGFDKTSGYVAAWQLLSRDAITALVCASDLSAIGAVEALRDGGLTMPVDVSIVGFGDFPSISVYPSLTTVNQCRFEIGCTAARAACRLLLGEEVSGVVFEGELIVRQSSMRNFVVNSASRGRFDKDDLMSQLWVLRDKSLLQVEMGGGWTIDRMYTQHFDGITARATRTVDDTAYLIYKAVGVSGFESDLYCWNAPADSVSWWVSEDDGATYRAVPLTVSDKVFTTNPWGRYRIINADPLPPATTHLKMVIEPTGNNWDPQLSEIRLSYARR